MCLLEALDDAIPERSHDGNGWAPDTLVMCSVGAAVLGRLKKLKKVKIPSTCPVMWAPRRSYNASFHFKVWNQTLGRGGVRKT